MKRLYVAYTSTGKVFQFYSSYKNGSLMNMIDAHKQQKELYGGYCDSIIEIRLVK